MKLTKLGHPKSSAVIALAQTFEALYLETKRTGKRAKVYMSKPLFNECGTSACHAGWYGIAKFDEIRHLPDSLLFSFDVGRVKMAKDLGFKNPRKLENWVISNPALWGNKYGCMIFYGDEAFSTSKIFPLTLNDIAKHWFEVAGRLADLENKK